MANMTFKTRKHKYGLYKHQVDEYDSNGTLVASRSFKDLIQFELYKQDLLGRGYTEHA